MGQRKTLRQILEILPEIVRDVEACEESLNDAKGKQHLRRSYVRALFTMIEGTVHSIKELEFAELNSREKPHIPTLVALKENVFKIDRRGKIQEGVKFVPMANNLRFAGNIFNKTFEKQLNLGVGATEWENFKTSIKIRNRITHPKEVNDITISDDELLIIKKVNEWFNGIIKDMIEHIREYYK